MSKLYGLFYCSVKCHSKSRPTRHRTTFSKSKLSLNNKYKEKHPQKSPFLPPFQMPFFDFSPLANSWWFFSNARLRVSHSRNKNRVVALLGFSRLGFLWELVIREGRFWNFYGGVVTRRHSFGFSRNNMKGALYHWRNPMGAKHRKGKIFNFSFLVFMGLRGRTPYAVSSRREKQLSAPSKILRERTPNF